MLVSAPLAAWEARPYTLMQGFEPGSLHMGVRFLGALELPSARFGGIELAGLSGLAYDADEDIVYALSDRGALFHLRLHMEGERLADVTVLAAHPLRDGAGNALRGRAADSEGLAALDARNGQPGDTRLLVSFERQVRVAEYRPDGRLNRELTLPDSIAGAGFVSPNRGLESVLGDNAGNVYVAPERPLRGESARTLPLLALDGRRFDYPLASHDSAVVAMDFMPDGELLLLERDLDLMSFRLLTRLRLVRGLDGTSPGGLLSASDLATFDTPGGWRIDNFEGLTRLEGERFLMVSDDNQHVLQRTLLVLLERIPGRDGNSPKFERVQGPQN